MTKEQRRRLLAIAEGDTLSVQEWWMVVDHRSRPPLQDHARDQHDPDPEPHDQRAGGRVEDEVVTGRG